MNNHSVIFLHKPIMESLEQDIMSVQTQY